MQTRLTEEMRQNVRALEADSILRACVHCGFCTATCPTYQLLGDELDGPRGRIYLIKQVLEATKSRLKHRSISIAVSLAAIVKPPVLLVCAITICWISGVILSSRK